MNIKEIIASQKAYFAEGRTWPVEARLTAIRRLKKGILVMQDELLAALKEDLGKSATEGYMTEAGMLLSEISYLERHIKSWCRPKYRPTPLAQFPARSYELPCPYGAVLVMSPWNYPLLLSLEPTINAIAAGNTVVLKPSAYSPATSQVIAKLCRHFADPRLLAVVTGGRGVNADLLEQRYDYIFFTGGKTVGRLVMEKASRHLTPVTLELGGKSPCLVDATADLKLAARRIVFGKFLNLGQTCVAPDYVLVHKSVKEKLLKYLVSEIAAQFGEQPLENPDYGNIINQKHFDRLSSLLKQSHIYYGGGMAPAELRIAPTIVEPADLNSPVMAEEIFGPLLPVLTWNTWEEARAVIETHPTPLAMYIFSRDKAFCSRVICEISFGGGCINDTVIHLATSAMPFGGVGESGMGGYHGKRGFDTFTHTKSIVDKKLWLDLPLRYQPYTRQKDHLIRTFFK